MRRFLVLLFCIPLLSNAQKLTSIEEKTRDFRKMDGYIPVYWDDSSGKLYLELDRFDSEMLYLVSLSSGLGSNDIGLDRGLPGGGRVVRFSRVGRKVLMTEPNYGYRAVGGDEGEKRAVDQSFAKSVLWGFQVEAVTGNRVLVDATDFLLRDAMGIAPRLKQGKQGNYSIDKSRSAIYLPATRNFPLNTELDASITFTNGDGITGRFVQSVTPSAEAITLRIHQSFVQLPDDQYQPRTFDPRSGFYPVTYFDYSTPVSEPIQKYLVARHRLKKKDPAAAVSDPVKPIVYYLDNGTPEPIRSALLEGARWWNQAFEAAGYRNAFIVKILPDSADPMDVRYNVINWVHRSTRGWSYGNSIVDPRTGEIIKGQVSLGSLRVRQDYLIATGLLAPYGPSANPDDPMLKLALARLRQLAAHEVGHTLGLMHNYISSADNRASVMDYPHPLVKLDSAGRMDLSDAYATGIGEWDKSAITWGYQDFPPSVNDTMALNRILTAAEQKGMPFISDRDARAPGGLHPQAHLWDNGVNAVDGLHDVMKIRQKALEQFGIDNIRPGTAMAFLEDVLVPVYFYHRYQLEAVTKEIGGMYYTYALRGDGQPVTRPVPLEEQQRALDAVIGCLDPAQLLVPDSIARLIPPRPAGYNFTSELFNKRTGLAFDELAPAEAAADFPLSLLFNSERLSRMAENEMHGGLGVQEMLHRLVSSTWKAPRRTGMAELIEEQTEQILLTYMLAASIDADNSYAVRASMAAALEDLKQFISKEKGKTKNNQYKGHLILALERMKEPEKAKPSSHEEMPPGSPIGEDSF